MLLVFFSLCFAGFIDAAIYKLEEWQYEQMPPIITLDPYSSCLQSPGGKYCSGYVAYVADDPNPLNTMMQEYSAHTASHFNHTKALYGVCLSETCKDIYDGNNNITITTQDLKPILEACLNHTLWEKYNLKVKVENNISCHEHGEDGREIGGADMLMAAVLIALLLLNVTGSLFDIYWTNLHHWPVSKILLSFSVLQNWKKLKASPSSDPKQGAFIALYGMRSVLTICVIMTHSMMPSFYCSNPGYVENEYSTSFLHIILNGTHYMQIYFFTSGFLMVYYFQLYVENGQITWKIITISIIKRWLRLSVSYAVIIGITSTWLQRVGSGPIWDEVVILESLECRRDWWKHLLYFNNYVDDSRCMPQAWYTAADFQLFLLGIIIFIICHKSKFRNVILSSMLIIGMIVPALHTYFQDLDGSLILSPSTILESFITSPTFNETYKRGHTNIPGYIIGMSCGYLVYYLQKNNFSIKKHTGLRLIYWLATPFSLYVSIKCKFLYEDGPRPHLLYRTLMAAFINPLYGLVMAIVFMGFVFKIDDVYRGLFEWRGWRVPGRVSYIAFLLHVLVIRTAVGTITQPFLVSYPNMILFTLSTVLKTFVASCIFWVTVEAPLAQITKYLLFPDTARDLNKMEHQNGIKKTT